MKRILWLAKGLGRGGAEQLLLGATRHVDPERFQVEVAYLLPEKDALVPEFEARGVTVHCVENRSPFDPSWTRHLRDLVRRREFDLVHTHMPYVASGARVVLPRSVVLVHTEHNLWDRYRVPTRWANLVTYSRNATVIAVSRAVADSIRFPSWLPSRCPPIEVVYHGADLARVSRGRGGESGCPSEARYRSGCFRHRFRRELHGEEGPSHAPRGDGAPSACDAQRASRARRARSAGSRATARVSELALDHVHFTGMRDDVYELLAGFDIFALSSRYEGLPIALLEAMATGVACVATSVGGVPEVIVDGREGRLVPAGDTAGFASALEEVLTDESMRRALGRAARERGETFDLRRAVRRTEAIYDRCLVGS